MTSRQMARSLRAKAREPPINPKPTIVIVASCNVNSGSKIHLQIEDGEWRDGGLHLVCSLEWKRIYVPNG
jgi:hypothetical protein